MLLSITEATGTGSLIEVPVPPYISKAHLTVYVDFIPTTAFEWLDDSRIRVLVPLNKKVRVVRKTSPETRLTLYKDGTSLGGETLNVDSLQAFYMAQEALDLAALSGSVVGQPAAGTEATTTGLLQLLTGQINTNQLAPALAALVGKVDAGSDVAGSINWRIQQEALQRASAITQEAADRAAGILAEAQARQTAITQEATTRATADSALTTQVTTLTASVSGAVAAVQTEATSRADGDRALGQRIDTVTVNLGNLSASVTDRFTALTTAEETLASRVTVLESSGGGSGVGDTTPIYAAITSEANARTSADTALSSQLTTLTSRVGTAESAITSEVNARTTAVSGVASSVTALTTRVGTAESAIQAEQTARSSGDSALATQISTVQSTLNGNIGTVQSQVNTLSTNLGTTQANYTLKVAARQDGKLAIAGIGLNATASDSAPTQSSVILMADQFFFVPSAAGLNQAPTALLTAGIVNGQNTTVFNAGLWGDKTVPARVVVDGFLEARHFTAGVVKAAYIDTRGLSITDMSGNPVIQLGSAIDWSKLGGTTNLTGMGYVGDLAATKNSITYGASAPAAPGNGDIWVDTSVTPNVTRTRVAGGWQVAANLTTNTNQLTDGAGLGQTALWSSVTGTGKPADNATVGAPAGTLVAGQDASTLVSDVATAKGNAGAALSGLAAKLNLAGGQIQGRVTMAVADGIFAGTDLANGVYFGNNGIVARKNGVTSLAVDTAGNATFAGVLSAATGTFAGSLSAATGTFTGALSGVTGTFAGSLSAATGTFSGALTASAVNAVNTINLADNAVTVPVAASWAGASPSASATTPSADFGGGRVVGTVSLVSYVGASPDTFGAAEASVTIYRDSTPLTSFPFNMIRIGPGSTTMAAQFTDAPPGGAHTYSAVCECDAAAYLTRITISALGAKK